MTYVDPVVVARGMALKGLSTVTDEMIDNWADAHARAATSDVTASEPAMPPWGTVDFRPAPAGWRLVFVNAEFGCHRVEPMAGWLVQERTYDDPYTKRPETYRRVVAAGHADPMAWGGEVLDVEHLDAGDDLYAVLGPDQADPTDAEITGYVRNMHGAEQGE